MRWVTELIQAFGHRLVVASIFIASGLLLFGNLLVVPYQWRWMIYALFLVTGVWTVLSSVAPVTKAIAAMCRFVGTHPLIRPLSHSEKQILLCLGRSPEEVVSLRYYSYGGSAVNLLLRSAARKLEQRGMIYRYDLAARLTERGEKWAAKVSESESRE
jgi:hypothetical protein